MKASDLTSGTMDMENIELAVEVPNTKYIYTNTNTTTQIHEGHVYTDNHESAMHLADHSNVSCTQA